MWEVRVGRVRICCGKGEGKDVSGRGEDVRW